MSDNIEVRIADGKVYIWDDTHTNHNELTVLLPARRLFATTKYLQALNCTRDEIETYLELATRIIEAQGE